MPYRVPYRIPILTLIYKCKLSGHDTKVHNKSVQFQTWSFMFSCQAGLDATCLAVMNASRTLRRFGRHVRAVEHGDGGADSGVLDVLVRCDCD